MTELERRIYLAVRTGNSTQLSELIAAGLGGEALLCASQWGYFEAVKVLIECKVDINAIDDDLHTALHFASDYGHLNIVKALVAAGANLELREDNKRCTALHYSSMNGYLEIVEALLAAGANLGRGDVAGNTALHHASRYGHLPVVETLITAGANVNDTAYSGWTPLHAASLGGHLPVIEALLAAGADVKACYYEGKSSKSHYCSAFDIAYTNGWSAVVDYLKQFELNEEKK